MGLAGNKISSTLMSRKTALILKKYDRVVFSSFLLMLLDSTHRLESDFPIRRTHHRKASKE